MYHQYRTQVDHALYKSDRYMTPERWTTYALIINEVLTMKPKTVLEIGPGNKFVTNILADLGFDVMTLDLDGSINPDYIYDVSSADIQQIGKRFDLVIAAEVLEHIEYEDTLGALKNLRQIASRLLITLPHTNNGSAFWHLALKIPSAAKLVMSKKIFYRRAEHHFNGQHYWEIGKKRYPLSKLKKDIASAGWKIVKEYLNPDYTYHHVFILEKSSDR